MMSRKHFSTAFSSVLVSSLFLFSCVDDGYDLSKDIDLTIEVGGDAFMIPLGYTENITLDKMIDTTDVLKLDNDGLYSIKKADKIDDVTVEVKDVNIKIDNPTFDGIVVNFEDRKVNDFTIDNPSSETDLNAPDINVNVALPKDKEMNTNKTVLPVGTPAGQNVNKEVVVNDETPFDFDYPDAENAWPAEVQMIKSIYLKGESNTPGQKVSFSVNTSALVNTINGINQQVKSFVITFPAGFVLAVDPSSPGTVNGNVFTVTNDVISASQKTYSFYVVRQDLNNTMIEGVHIHNQIKYTLTYSVTGTTKAVTEDANLLVNMQKTSFVFDKADAVTNDIEAKMTSGEFNIESTISGLDDIQKVNYVTFKDSKFVLNISDLGLPIGFTSGDVVVQFPARFTLEKLSDNKGGAMTYANNQLTIPAQSLSGAQATLALKKVTLGDKEIQNNTIQLNEPVTYSLKNGNPLILQGEVSSDKLSGLNQKKMHVNVEAGLMKVENSNVVADAVTADVEDNTTFKVNEDVDEALKVLKTVAWKEGTSPKINFRIDFPNFPRDIKNLKFVDFKINLPKFIQFADEDNVVDGVLTLNDQFVAATGYTKVLTVKGMDFSYMNNNTGLKTEPQGGKTWLKINTDNDVLIEGVVSTLGDETINTDVLQNIKVQPSVSIDEMPVGKVTGTVDPVIDPVNESVSLDLGSDLDFLKEQGTNLDFSNPQIALVLSNTIGVPVDMKLMMNAKGANGRIIDGSSVPEQQIKLEPAVTDGVAVTTKFLLSRNAMTVPESTGDTIYKNVVIPELANLMKIVPDKVDFDLTAKASGTEHHIDLSKSMVISGNYNVIVPLEFKAIDINYKDTIDNLQDDLSDVSGKITHAELKVIGDATNAVPVDLVLSVNPLDANGNLLQGIKAVVTTDNQTDNKKIAACVDESTPTVTKIFIDVTSEGGDLKSLENLELVVHAVATETAAGISLKKSQYVKLSNLFVKVKKANLDLNE